MIKVKLVGATGYGGVGLVELMLRHPEIEIGVLVAANDTGRAISHFWPHLAGLCDEMVYAGDAPEVADADADVVVYATPDRIGMRLAPQEVAKGRKILDYSGDFRFNGTAVYEEYATRLGLDSNHLAPELLPDTVYGLAELHRAGDEQELQILAEGLQELALLRPAVDNQPGLEPGTDALVRAGQLQRLVSFLA